MVVQLVILRVMVSLVFFGSVDLQQQTGVPKSSHGTKMQGPPSGKYPPEVHKMYRELVLKKQTSNDDNNNETVRSRKNGGVWSPWSPWTQCSRTCGGGITQQTRYCVSSIDERKLLTARFRRRNRRQTVPGCVGLYKRIHVCNNQECPSRSSIGGDFRSEQCAAFNHRPFKGKLFAWQPFHQDRDECALNCRPLGHSFFATLNKTVVDGTPCKHPLTSAGRSAPSGTRGVCVDGRCKSVSSSGIVGSIDVVVKPPGNFQSPQCTACLKGSCRTINGLYTRPDLPPGYSPVAQIPQGACNVFVQQLKPTRNFLAMRTSNGTFVINGDWKTMASSARVEGAGTRWAYVKQDGVVLETISGPGPLTDAIDIMIVTYQSNPGIKYSYAVPMITPPPNNSPNQIAPPLLKRPQPLDRLENNHQRDEAPRGPTNHHRRTKVRRRFVWKVSGVSQCSKPCGASGLQTIILTCVREHTQTPVIERRCSHLKRPNLQPATRCNVKDCPPRWGTTAWGACSTTCGVGVQRMTARCTQELETGRVVHLSDSKCGSSTVPPTSRVCNLGPCERDNDVASISRSHSFKTLVATPAVTRELSPWLVTDWSSCSESCGTGIQTRLVLCFDNNNNSNCTNPPDKSRSCASDRKCGGQWFTGPWSVCHEDSCSSPSKQTREVYCVIKIRGQSHILAHNKNEACRSADRPVAEQSCRGGRGETGECPRWFMGEWGACEGCGDESSEGVQKRDVRCLNYVNVNETTDRCHGDEMPVARRACGCGRHGDHRGDDDDDDRTLSDQSCSDRIRNCYLAVQARLCQYPYYANQCCSSCKKSSLSQNDNLLE